ncbi:hypothetical protein GCM10009850_007840 [Nonomuraea monospora]|uniref:Luciferase-like monooxygenase n=1 Tax=Nonomuraea monospora TaxID=568818 RepID=A0ABP5P111_9ACTN
MSEGRRVRVGIVLPRPAGDPGEWLTEAVAFEAAGADALWVEHGAAPELDPLTLTAALAAVTYRALLVVAVAPDDGRSHALATVERLSRGRLALIGEVSGMRTVVRLEDGGYREGASKGEGEGEGVGEGAGESESEAVSEGGGAGGGASEGVNEGEEAGGGAGEGVSEGGGAGEGVSEGVDESGGTGEGGGGRRWVPVGVPGGRAAWREALREAEERGHHGVLVPADPRLLDLLRNPEDPGGRHDLQLAQG